MMKRSGCIRSRCTARQTFLSLNSCSAEQEQLLGTINIPAGELMAAYVKPYESDTGAEKDDESFCVHISGEAGCRFGGRWCMQSNSVGSIVGVECVFETNYTEKHSALQVALSTVEVRGGPWLFEHTGVRSCGATALELTRRCLVKVRGSVLGGYSDRRTQHSEAGRCVMALHCRDFARCVLSRCHLEFTGMHFMPAALFSCCIKATLESCVFERNTHSIGILDWANVKVSGCTMKVNDQGAVWAAEYRGPVTGGSDETSVKQQDVMARRSFSAIGRVPYWDNEVGQWKRGKPRETKRYDPIEGNVTDGWARGMPGWTDGVPESVKQVVDFCVDSCGMRLSDIPDEFFKWGQVGDIHSLKIANGSVKGDILIPGFNGGSHQASLRMTNSIVHGDVWSTVGRPGMLDLLNITYVRDEWVEKFMGNSTERITTRELMESAGMIYDERKKDYYKPIRRTNGMCVDAYVRACVRA